MTGGKFRLGREQRTGGASFFAVNVGHLRTIPDWTGMPLEAQTRSGEERVVARLDRPAFERVIQALRLDSAA